MVVSACIIDKGYEHVQYPPVDEHVCVFSNTDATCNWGRTIGWLTIIYLICECVFIEVFLEGEDEPGKFFRIDAILSAMWTFIWFISFVTFASAKKTSVTLDFSEFKFSTHAINNANTAIVFSVFTTIGFVSTSGISLLVSSRS